MNRGHRSVQSKWPQLRWRERRGAPSGTRPPALRMGTLLLIIGVDGDRARSVAAFATDVDLESAAAMGQHPAEIRLRPGQPVERTNGGIPRGFQTNGFQL